MANHKETQLKASTALLRLLDQRIRSNGVNPPFELANIAVDRIAEHAIALGTKLHQDALEVDAGDNPDPTTSSTSPPPSQTSTPLDDQLELPIIDAVDHPDD